VTIRAVTFDCWGTLIDDSELEDATSMRVDAIVAASNGRLDYARAEELIRRAWLEHHKRWVDGVQFGAAGVARVCAAELGDDRLCDRLQEAFEEAGRHGTIAALPGAADTLTALRDTGIRTALVCDTGMTPGRVVRDFLSELELLPHLEFCAFSDEVGEPKPNPGIFKAALAAIGADPFEAVHVGDLLRTDVHGARDAGMKTIRITAVNDDLATRFSWDADAAFDKNASADHPEVDDADEVVASHSEIPAALRKLGARV
jgi:putative hydrolase of the HAD superfamily